MALRSPLTLQPYDYIGDSTGRPLDKGQIYIGVAGQDPEFYQVPVFLDAEMTKPIDQPIRTNDGFVDFAGDLKEIYASAEIYSVKVLDKEGRKVIYKAEMMRDNLTDDALQSLDDAIAESQAQAVITTAELVNESIDDIMLGEYQTQLEAKVDTLSDDVSNLSADVSAQKLDTGITATAKFGGVERSQSEKNLDVISIKDFGCVGGGLVNNDAALTLALNSGAPLFIPDEDFLYTQVVVDADVVLTGSGRFVYSGSAATNPAYTATMVFNGAADIENLNIKTSGLTDAIYDLASFEADDVNLKYLNLVSENQRNQTGGVNFYGNNINIGVIKSKNIARPTAFVPRGLDVTWRKNININAIITDTYIRGTKFRYAENVNVGRIHCYGRWQGVSFTPGYNGVLCESVKSATFGNVYIADSVEHGFRFGCPLGTDGYHITSLTTKDTGGCGFKANPLTGQFVKNGVIGSLTVTNAGNGSSLGNKEALRLTAVDNLQIGSFNALQRCSRAVLLADITNLRVGSFYCENVVARAIAFNQDSDASVGNCSDIVFDNVVAYCSASARHAIDGVYNNGRTISGLTIKNMYATGHSHTAVNLEYCDISKSIINIRVGDSDSGAVFEGVTGKDVVTTSHKGVRRYKGLADQLNITSFDARSSGTLVPLTDSYDSSLLVSSLRSDAGLGKYGGWFGFGRIGSTRRAGAIAVKQTGSSTSQSGLSFFTQSTVASSDTVLETMTLKHNGAVSLPRLPTSADGLVSGDIWNDGGTLKIV